MNLPEFSAQASLYRSRNNYRFSGGDFCDSIPAQSILPAYIPGSGTQNRCSGCTDICGDFRDVCLAKTALEVFEGCAETLLLGCGPVIAMGFLQTAACYAHYSECFGYCNIPTVPGVWKSSCCPKVCGIPTPGIAGSGCCDLGETCKGLGMRDNTRDGCCPVGRDCGSVCCAPDEKCCGNICCPQDWYCPDPDSGGGCVENYQFGNTPPPPPPVNNCIFGEAPCGPKCCPPGLVCCGYSAQFGPNCKTSCIA